MRVGIGRNPISPASVCTEVSLFSPAIDCIRSSEPSMEPAASLEYEGASIPLFGDSSLM